MKRGDIVIAKLYGGATAERRVIRCYEAQGGKSVVVICNEDEWQFALAEKREPEGIGFPAQDISNH